MPESSGNGDPLLRFFANTGREAAQLTARDCPTSTMISAPAWKHWAVMLMAVVLGAGLLLAGHTWPEWGPNCGPGLPRLLKSTSSPVVTWFYTVLLFTSAQGAVIIWWARSRSLKDFDGNYQIWGWAALTWIVFSFATATRAHIGLSITILHYIRWETTGAALWCWLIPATAWGWGIALRLEPELRGDRGGHLTFLAAGGWYMAVAGMLCQQQFWPKACPAELSVLLAAAFQLLAHTSLFLSTTLHARYVLVFSAEPPVTKRRTATKTASTALDTVDGKKRGMWSWLSRPEESEADETDESADGKPKRGKKRATATAAKKRTTTRKTPRRTKAAEEMSEGEGWNEAEATEDASASVKQEAPALEMAGQTASSTSQKNYRFDDAEEASTATSYTETEEGDADDFKGLSKKERRRLQQQMRDNDRKNR